MLKKINITLVELLVIASIFVLLGAILYPIYFPGPCSDPEVVRTQIRMWHMKTCLSVFEDEHNEYADPILWREQIDSCLGVYHEDTPELNYYLDEWGNRIEWCQAENGEHFIFSRGKNGIDNGGKKDDLILKTHGDWVYGRPRQYTDEPVRVRYLR